MCNSSAPALAKTIQYLSLIRDITCLLNIFLIFVIFIFFLTTFVELIIYNILFYTHRIIFLLTVTKHCVIIVINPNWGLDKIRGTLV